MDTLVVQAAAAPDKSASVLPQLLTFVSALLWQAIIGGFLIYYRRELGELLRNLASLKVANMEVAFQRPEANTQAIPSKVEKEIAESLAAVGASGFLSPEGIRQILVSTGLVKSVEAVGQPLLIFSTSRQHTWLVPFGDRISCVLDGTSTREKGRLLQWVIEKSRAEPIVAVPYKKTVGMVSIGNKRDWLYSVRLYPQPSDIESAIRKLLRPDGQTKP
jgi:hypothetical protein